MTTALVQLVIATGIDIDTTGERFAEALRNNAEIGRFRARAVTNLETMGWTLLRRPELITNTDAIDVVAYWRKDFERCAWTQLCADCADAQQRGVDRDCETGALDDMRTAGAYEDLNFSLLWAYTGHDGEHGPDHEWGTEGPSRAD